MSVLYNIIKNIQLNKSVNLDFIYIFYILGCMFELYDRVNNEC